jgi:hypothetical protein
MTGNWPEVFEDANISKKSGLKSLIGFIIPAGATYLQKQVIANNNSCSLNSH